MVWKNELLYYHVDTHCMECTGVTAEWGLAWFTRGVCLLLYASIKYKIQTISHLSLFDLKLLISSDIQD